MTATTTRSAAPTVALDPADEQVPFRPRRVRFDHDATADHWVPGDPHTTHVINVLHLLLPAGERWFGQVYRKALPLIDDPDLDRDVKAFIGQEATHARKHRSVAFDAYEAMGGGYIRRCLVMVATCIGLFSLLIAGTDHLLRHDHSVHRRQRRASVVRFHRAGRAGLLPTTSLLLKAIPRYLDPGYHPSGEARAEVATAYLATAPGVDHR